MSREGVKPACCQKACCDWMDMLQDLYEKTINSYRILNGLYPDGTGELRITAGDGIIIDTLSGNEVRISADELAGYSAIAPIHIDTDQNTIGINIDDAPILNSSQAVRSGGTYAAIRARGSQTDPVEEATHATNADYQTSAGSAANATHQTSADSATNAGHQTSAGEAVKLSTARTVQTDLESTAAASFDGSASITPGISGVLPIANGGTGNTEGLAVGGVGDFEIPAQWFQTYRQDIEPRDVTSGGVNFGAMRIFANDLQEKKLYGYCPHIRRYANRTMLRLAQYKLPGTTEALSLDLTIFDSDSATMVFNKTNSGGVATSITIATL